MTEPKASSTLALRYFTTNVLMLATSSDTLMPNWANQGLKASLSREASKGNCSRSKGNSFAKMGTISSRMDSNSRPNTDCTIRTASTRGNLPLPRLSSLLTMGVKA